MGMDFWEVLTLYYIIKSGMPLCECCGILILETYFSCVECFDCPHTSYSLCIYSYRSNASRHNHDGRQQFLDTFMLLEINKKRTQPQPTDPDVVVPVQQPSWCRPNVIVPAAGMSRWKDALMALEVGLSIGSISTTLCTIL